MPLECYNRKKFYIIVLLVVCDADRIFGKVCAGQPDEVHDAGQFVVSLLHA